MTFSKSFSSTGCTVTSTILGFASLPVSSLMLWLSVHPASSQEEVFGLQSVRTVGPKTQVGILVIGGISAYPYTPVGGTGFSRMSRKMSVK